MARPATPKLPVPQTLISEVLQRVSNAKVKSDKIKVLREYKSPALTKILLCNFATNVHFVFPPGKTPYTPSKKPKGVDHTRLFTEHRFIDKFIVKKIGGIVFYGCSMEPRPRIQQLKKEQMWMQLMESLHPEEAALLDLVKDKKLNTRYKVSRQNVIDAFPELKLQQDPDYHDGKIKAKDAPAESEAGAE